MISALHGPWLLAAALLLIAVVLRRSPRLPFGELWVIGSITVCAAAARLLLGLWGPLHVNGQGPLWIRGALDPAALAGYGPGYFELFNWVTRLGPSTLLRAGVAPDRAIFAANALLSALSPALLYAAARLTGVGRGGALAAAVVLAADAVTARTAASEGYFSSLIALVLGVYVALALAVRAHLRRDQLATGLALGAAGLLAAATARIHPMGYVPLALCPLVVLGAAQPDAWRTRLARAAAAAIAIGATVLLTSGNTIIIALQASPMTGHAFTGLELRDAVLLLGLLALVWGLRRWLKLPWLPVLGILSLMVMLATQDSFLQHPLWQLCYQRLFWPGVLLGAASALPQRLQGPGWALGGATMVVAAMLAQAFPYLGAPTTEQLEYRFLQEVLRDAPPSCTLASVSHAGNRIWDIPSYLVPSHGPQGTGAQRNVQSASDLDIAVDCLLYVRPSLCSSIEARALCESVESESHLEQVASRVFPAAPSYADLPYDRPEVEVVVFRVSAHEVGNKGGQAAVSDGAAISPEFAQSLYDRLTALKESDGCRVVRFDTSRFRITIGLQSGAGTERSLELATATGSGDAGRRAGNWALAVPAALERDCGVTLVTLEGLLQDVPAPASVGNTGGTNRNLEVSAGLLVFAVVGLLFAVAGRRAWAAKNSER